MRKVDAHVAKTSMRTRPANQLVLPALRRQPKDKATNMQTRELKISPSRTLVVSPVYDTYWRFAAARQDLFMRRVAGDTPPWTQDPVLSVHRFTNAYRASDRVSQYLIRSVIYEGPQSADEVFFRTLLFKLFNRIETWEALVESLGRPTWRNFDFERYARVLDAVFAKDQRLYSAAYIMPSPSFGSPRKHRNHLRLLEHIMSDGAPRRVAGAASMQAMFEVLRSYPSFGDFLAFQFTIDLNYSELTQFSEMDYVVAGPGARDGIQKCFVSTAGLTEADIIRVMAERASAEFERLGLRFQTLWGRELQLIDCQNIFCEVSKYARVVHPDVVGESGRVRIKQKFTAKDSPVPQWYPPKWGLVAPAPSLRAERQPNERAQVTRKTKFAFEKRAREVVLSKF